MRGLWLSGHVVLSISLIKKASHYIPFFGILAWPRDFFWRRRLNCGCSFKISFLFFYNFAESKLAPIDSNDDKKFLLVWIYNVSWKMCQFVWSILTRYYICYGIEWPITHSSFDQIQQTSNTTGTYPKFNHITNLYTTLYDPW